MLCRYTHEWSDDIVVVGSHHANLLRLFQHFNDFVRWTIQQNVGDSNFFQVTQHISVEKDWFVLGEDFIDSYQDARIFYAWN